MAQNVPKNALDHLILFLPADPETNLPKIPSFISDNFTLTPGGTHADGLTSNTLILLSDGCYIELISFVPSAPPDKISSHWWSYYAAHPGWADWCLTNTLSPTANHAPIRASHQAPLHGSRQRPDGTTVKWAVTFPQGPHGGQSTRGLVPFFCHDVTPRTVRVPLSEERTTHPSGVLGVHSLSVLVKDEAVCNARVTLTACLRHWEQQKETFRTVLTDLEHADTTHACFGAQRVVDVPELGDKDRGTTVKLIVASREGEREKVNKGGRDFWYGDVVLKAKAREGKEKGTKERLDVGQDLRGLWIVYT
ncbi:uncharacterized protein N0V89_000037 [Didymosphaeria variabile]|uniref:Glyoxalase-like domain-containing protein n=1 Tax=Didymosphaeria variabile TaxID=1932322 RepID=A0A9W8XUD4_9PLEO|nr:uncharacterized protein N0V89_000037 [Didymosphaeria variabile]KAJ4359483.1 hypothetical protein N0V89_000037 [Didymosphaeria variabile]